MIIHAAEWHYWLNLYDTLSYFGSFNWNMLVSQKTEAL